jgi:hypothetical protein
VILVAYVHKLQKQKACVPQYLPLAGCIFSCHFCKKTNKIVDEQSCKKGMKKKMVIAGNTKKRENKTI